MPKIPHCDPLFMRFFDLQYSEEDRTRKGYPATRPDMLQEQRLTGKNVDDLSPLSEESRRTVLAHVETMARSALNDSNRYLSHHEELNLDWVDAFDRYWTTKRIAELIRKSDPTDTSSDYFIVCVEFGAALGHVMRSLQPRLAWIPEWPYWESSIFDPKSGTIIPPVHWAIKKMSSYGVDDGFAEKVKMMLNILEEER